MLYTKHSARQQCLHIAPPICNDVDDHLFATDPIDEPVEFEMRLTIFADAEGEQFFGEHQGSE